MLPTPGFAWGFTGHNDIVSLNVPDSADICRIPVYRGWGSSYITAGTSLPAATMPSLIRTLDRIRPPATKNTIRAMMAQR